MKPFFVVLARDRKYVPEKIKELKTLAFPYIVVCGEKINHPNVVYRTPKGKYDAINFGAGFVPRDVKAVAFNDVDTKIHNIEAALRQFREKRTSFVFAKVSVKKGPQILFYTFLDALRSSILVTANGELMLIEYDALKRLLPLKPCKAEDTYILFKVLEQGGKASFCPECYLETERTESFEQQEAYKRRTVAGIYQALSYTNPPALIKLFYILLPFLSPLLMMLGIKGYYWARGILLGFVDYLRGDRTGVWQPTYVDQVHATLKR